MASQVARGQESAPPAHTAAAADYEAPSWMAARRADERRQASWQAEVKAAQTVVVPPNLPDPGTQGVHLFPDIRLPVHQRNLPQPVVVMPEVEDPAVEALRLQAHEEREEAVELKREQKAASRHPGRAAHGQGERRRLKAAQQSRREDEARLEAAQQSRRQDQARLEAAQQSRREDQARLEAAQAERRRQH